ncbi:MAG: hypothetical protein HKL79_00995 [Thermoplasmata archaeon]|nr:hypothetical protein [Thermoplasmata archaeon]
MTYAAGVLVLTALVGLFAGAPLSLIHRRVGYAATLVASGLLVVAAILVLTGGPVTAISWSGVIGEPESIRLDGLSAFFALTAGIVWIGTSAFSLDYDQHSSSRLAVAYSLTLGSIAIVLTSTNFLVFLAGWEAMTLASYWMILEATGRPNRIFSAAFVFLAFGEASSLLIAVAIAAFYAVSGSFGMMATSIAGPLTSLVFVAALLGFGLKMGIAPFHMSEWLPIAHSSAPSNASAVLSATLTLAGVYGLFRMLTLLPEGPSWWGGLLLIIGAVSALLGALFAAVSEHAKGLPAYSTIENNGLILVALGIALIARVEDLPTLFTFALFAAFFQALAHAITKATLFLCAGYIERSTGTVDLNRVRGRPKAGNAAASGAILVATLSLAAGPPLAGFVSEWMILEALFQSFRFSVPALQFLGLLAGAAVALAAGLVVVAMVKFLGFSVLWKPVVTDRAPRRWGLGAPMAALAAVIVGLGVLSPWILQFLTPAASTLAGYSLTAPVSGLLAIPNGWSIVSGSPFGIVSPPALAIALVAGLVPALAYFALGGSPKARRTPVWASGRPPNSIEATYTSFGYSTGMRIMLRGLLGTREIRQRAGPAVSAEIATPEAYNVELEVLDVFKVFYDSLARFGLWFAEGLKRAVMPGRIGRYLAYILVVVLLVIIYTALFF